MTLKIAVVAQGIYEKSDSIAYDCLWQYDKLREIYPEPNEVRVFAERIHPRRYAARPIAAIDRLWPWLEGNTESAIIYHYCDGWPLFENRLAGSRSRLIVRWHNNTPPWFFAAHSARATASTVRGFQRVLCLAETPRTEFWVNSSFSGRQLSFLGVPENRIHVVYPASAYLCYATPAGPSPSDPRKQQGETVHLLFVGRITPHKGHKHLIAVAAIVQRSLRQKVALHFVGRPDPSMHGYVDELLALARKLSVSLRLHGEVEQHSLHGLYEQCDVFLALSEHEGFCLPVFEAMRLGIPVVALRSAAIKDLFGGHPLGADALDYREIALRVIAALDPQGREFVVAWQRDQILAQYDTEIVTRQVKDGIAGRAYWSTGAVCAPCVPVERSVETLRAKLWTRLDKIFSELSTLRELPKDARERLVTRYDIAGYSALLASYSPSLYDAALAHSATSNRRFLGPPLRMARRVALSVQSGLISAITVLDANASARFERMERALSRLQGSIEAIQEAHAYQPAEQARRAPVDRDARE